MMLSQRRLCLRLSLLWDARTRWPPSDKFAVAVGCALGRVAEAATRLRPARRRRRRTHGMRIGFVQRFQSANRYLSDLVLISAACDSRRSSHATCVRRLRGA